MEILRRVHANNIVKWAADKPDVLVLSADLTSSCEADAFRAAYPDRFFSMGIAEQNMLSFAGGLAREGFVPFVHNPRRGDASGDRGYCPYEGASEYDGSRSW